ncbi:MAG: YraN family protein [Clostridia bacterium]|nr:YraN family protein [Clostridia bacterium]
MNKSNVNGKKGELIASKFLLQKGYEIEALNYHSRYGEIDIIASKDEYIVFVEVKTRSHNMMSFPYEAVTKSKQRKILMTANRYLSATECEKQPRYDIIEVYLSDDTRVKKHKVRQIESAFELEGYM